MSFEIPATNNENLPQFENRIEEIKNTLINEGYNKELDLEFVELWKNLPDGVSDKTHDNIDEIRNLLMDGAPGK